MAFAVSVLDFSVVDRARTLGALLRLLFALLEAISPKDVADLLTDFDSLTAVDPETAGRWLRDERRPSKQHLRLIVQLFQSHGLIGAPAARDRLFMRIAAFYARLDEPDFSRLVARRSGRMEEPQVTAEGRFGGLRREYRLAMALQSDLNTPSDDLTLVNAIIHRTSAPRQTMPPINIAPSRFAIWLDTAPVTPPTRWQKLVRKLRALIARAS